MCWWHRVRTRFFEKRVWFVDGEIFKILRIPFLEGSARTALTQPKTVVINEGTARKYFSNLPPLGRSLSIEIDYDTGASVTEDFQVTGVVCDAPANTHFKYDMLISMSTLLAYVPSLDQDWGECHTKYTYVKLGRNVSPAASRGNCGPIRTRSARILQSGRDRRCSCTNFFSSRWLHCT